MSVKVLSFDVGIKNLAYCLIEKTDEDFKILKWGIINLVDDRQLCTYELNNKRINIHKNSLYFLQQIY